MGTIRTSNNPVMLAWAREEIGYTIEQAAAAIGVSPKTLLAAESIEHPHPLTLKQLQTAADMYACPFGYFYFSEPPHKKSYKPVPDFRVESGHIGVDHYRLNYEIKNARDQRSVFIDLAETLDIELRPFKVLANPNQQKIGTIIRERLGVSDDDISSINYDGAYSYWKAKIENEGVLVYESQYIPAASGVIGAAIFYNIAPIILIKRGGDFNKRKLFTLLHEYAHLLLGKSAINDASAQKIDIARTDTDRQEVFCNKLAGEILVPSENINKADYAPLNLVEKMEFLARTFKITFSTAAVRLRSLGLVSRTDLDHLLDLRNKANQKVKPKKSGNIQIPRENIVRLDLGRPTFNIVLAAYGKGVLDVFDTSRILKLRVGKIDKLLAGVK